MSACSLAYYRALKQALETESSTLWFFYTRGRDIVAGSIQGEMLSAGTSLGLRYTLPANEKVGLQSE